MKDSVNPIQLAAVSNYKLAQLTFAPPDIHSLRKTALVKNTLDVLYKDTPKEWLSHMTRWTFFTPESLEEMTQESLESIFRVYVKIIERFHPRVRDVPDDDDDKGRSGNANLADASAIFSQPNLTLSNETMQRYDDKPLPKHPMDGLRRKSIRSRLSWTSDVGAQSIALYHLTDEITSLFDMEFSVDIKLSTAPKLPELSFANRRRSQHRVSVDSLMNLIPTFEAFPLPDITPPNRGATPPTRSSSLRYQSRPPRSESMPEQDAQSVETKTSKRSIGSDFFSDLTRRTVSLTKKKSIRKLASLVGRRKAATTRQPATKSTPSLPWRRANTLGKNAGADSAVTITSTTSAWSTTSDLVFSNYQLDHKPLPVIPSSDELNFPLPPTPEKKNIRESDSDLSSSASSILVKSTHCQVPVHVQRSESTPRKTSPPPQDAPPIPPLPRHYKDKSSKSSKAHPNDTQSTDNTNAAALTKKMAHLGKRITSRSTKMTHPHTTAPTRTYSLQAATS